MKKSEESEERRTGSRKSLADRNMKTENWRKSIPRQLMCSIPQMFLRLSQNGAITTTTAATRTAHHWQHRQTETKRKSYRVNPIIQTSRIRSRICCAHWCKSIQRHLSRSQGRKEGKKILLAQILFASTGALGTSATKTLLSTPLLEEIPNSIWNSTLPFFF